MEEVFEKVLNLQNTLEERAMAGLEDHSHIDTSEVTREEVERAAKKLQNGKAASDGRIVAELMKSGREKMMDWLVELIQEVWKTRQEPQIGRTPHLYPCTRRKIRKSVRTTEGYHYSTFQGEYSH